MYFTRYLTGISLEKRVTGALIVHAIPSIRAFSAYVVSRALVAIFEKGFQQLAHK